MQGTTKIYVGIGQNIYHLGDRKIIMKDMPRYKITWKKTNRHITSLFDYIFRTEFVIHLFKIRTPLNYFNIYIRRNTNFFALQTCALFI